MGDLVLGKFEKDYSTVVQTFKDTLMRQPSGGAALAIFKDGKPVVDIWGGESKPGIPWHQETSVLIYSCTKGLVSIMAHHLVELGLLDLEAPVSNYWPEFAQAGKGDIPVRWLLEHKSGLSAPRKDLTFSEILQLEPVLTALAEQEPIWEPGTGYAYHALTFGYLIGRVISGITDKSVQDFFQEVVAQPLNIRAWIGMPEGVDSSPATMIWPGDWQLPITEDENSPEYWTTRAMTLGSAFPSDLSTPGKGFNDPQIYKAELAGAGGIMSAYALAKIYSAAVTQTNGVRLFNDSTIENFRKLTVSGPSVFNEVGPWYRRGIGFMIDNPDYRPLLSDKSFGHDGLGGQYAFGDTKYRLSFAYLTNYLTGDGEGMARPIEIVNELRNTFNT